MTSIIFRFSPSNLLTTKPPDTLDVLIKMIEIWQRLTPTPPDPHAHSGKVCIGLILDFKVFDVGVVESTASSADV